MNPPIIYLLLQSSHRFYMSHHSPPISDWVDSTYSHPNSSNVYESSLGDHSTAKCKHYSCHAIYVAKYALSSRIASTSHVWSDDPWISCVRAAMSYHYPHSCSNSSQNCYYRNDVYMTKPCHYHHFRLSDLSVRHNRPAMCRRRPLGEILN